MKTTDLFKKHGSLLGLITLCMFCLFSFTACDDDNGDGPTEDVAWDFAPIRLYIEVQDANGNDLLDPDVPGNICNQQIYAIYEGETYEKDAFNTKSRVLAAQFQGLYTYLYSKDGKHRLAFGDFNGQDTFKDEKVTIVWEDGSQDVLTFSSDLKWKNHKPDITRTFKLNGKDNGERNSNFVFIKEPDNSTQKPDDEQATQNDDDDEPTITWDFAPIALYLEVQDAEGNNLMDPKTESNITKQNVKAIYKGKTYEKDVHPSQARLIATVFEGLYSFYDEYHSKKHYLKFGEFPGEETFENEEVIIVWEDEKQDTLTFSNKLEWKSKNEPVITRTYTLNGKDNGEKGNHFLFVKEPKKSSSEASE